MQETENYKVLSTKVSSDTYELLNRLAKGKGMRVYELMQMCADTLVRYMSDLHNLTPEMERAMGLFEHMTGWAGALNLCDPTAKARVSEATYYLTAGGKKGCRAVHVWSPYFGNWQQTENVGVILERTLEQLVPERYRRLRLLASAMGCGSILEMLDRMADGRAVDEMNEQEIRRSFEDCNRAENGKAVTARGARNTSRRTASRASGSALKAIRAASRALILTVTRWAYKQQEDRPCTENYTSN